MLGTGTYPIESMRRKSIKKEGRLKPKIEELEEIDEIGRDESTQSIISLSNESAVEDRHGSL